MKRYAVLAVFALAPAFFVACDSDSDDSESPFEAVEGTWAISEFFGTEFVRIQGQSFEELIVASEDGGTTLCRTTDEEMLTTLSDGTISLAGSPGIAIYVETGRLVVDFGNDRRDVYSMATEEQLDDYNSLPVCPF